MVFCLFPNIQQYFVCDDYDKRAILRQFKGRGLKSVAKAALEALHAQ